MLRNYAISAFAFALALYVIRYVPIDPYESLWLWVCYCVVCMVVFLVIDLTATILFAKGAKDSLRRVGKIKKLKN